MGGKGNVSRIVDAVTSVLEASGYPAVSPWYYPNAGEYATLLEQYGFQVEALWMFDRWTKLEHPQKGMREWLEMFARPWFEGIPVEARRDIVAQIESRLRAGLWRDGSWWADYRRLRAVCRLSRP
jgi:hypothetical protein